MNANERIMDQAVKAMHDKEGKYLTFSLAGEAYGIGILKVREIIGMRPVTCVPRVPSHIKGVINLRGKVIPVVDLRLRFGLAPVDYDQRACIIVVEIPASEGAVPMGVVVDAVSEVLNIKGEAIEPRPDFGGRCRTDFILGMAKTEGQVKILLDIDRVLTAEEIASIDRAA